MKYRYDIAYICMLYIANILIQFWVGYVLGTGKAQLQSWGNEDNQSTVPLNKPYYDTNTALFPSFTLSMHICMLVTFATRNQ